MRYEKEPDNDEELRKRMWQLSEKKRRYGCGRLHMNLEHARWVIEEWRIEYNQERPHSSLGNLTLNEFRLKQENMLAFSNTMNGDRSLTVQASR